MNKFKYPSLALIVLGGRCAAIGATRTADKNHWPVFEIRPAENGTLKDLFVAGLRPYRFPALEKTLLETKHLKVKLLQANGVPLPEFHAELARIDVEANWLLAELEFANAPMTVFEARKEMLRWIQFGTKPKRTIAELDSFLAAVAADYRGYNYGPNAIDHNFSINWEDVNHVIYGVWFQQARHPETPLAVRLKVSFPLSPIQAGTSFDIPIPPPPGYEHVDMTAPKDFGPDSPPDEPEIGRVQKAGVMPDVPATTQRPSSQDRWLWWLIGLAIVTVVFIAIVLKERRR